jgi:hypothetical protein
MPKYSLVFTCNDRPEFLKDTLEYWEQVRGIRNWDLWIFVEPSSRRDEVLRLIEKSSLDFKVILNEWKFGVLHNPWAALDTAFYNGADFAVLAEDDIIVSTDTAEYFIAASTMYSPEEFLGVSAFTSSADGDPSKILQVPSFGGLVWGTWKQNWYGHLRDTWDHDYSTHNGVPGEQAGWDWNINTRIIPQAEKNFISPDVSRSRHIGRYGAHINPQDFDKVSPSPSFERDRPVMSYYDGGEY